MKLTKTLIAASVAASLSACGGGSSSSGGGLDVNRYAGTYYGRADETLRGPGGVLTNTYNGNFTLNRDGSAFFNQGSSCVMTGGTVTSTANTFRAQGTSAQCYISGIGWCNIGMDYQGVFTGGKVEIDGSGVIRCPGYYDVHYTVKFNGQRSTHGKELGSGERDRQEAERASKIKSALGI